MSERATGPSTGSTRPWRASVRHRHGAPLWQHCGGLVGKPSFAGRLARPPTAPPTLASAPVTFGSSEGLRSWPFRWRRCQSGPRPVMTPACWRTWLEPRVASCLRAVAVRLAVRFLRESQREVRRGRPPGRSREWRVDFGDHCLRVMGNESAMGVNRASPRRYLRVHAATGPSTTLDHRCRPFGAEHWVATDSSEWDAMCRRPSTFG